MEIRETLNSAINSLLSNKVRAALTMLGVVIGVFSVVTLTSLGRGVQNYITDEFNALGSNLLFIAPGNVDFADDPAKSFTNNKLEKKHMDLIQTHAEDFVDSITPSFRVGKTVEYKNKNYFATLLGTSEQASKVFNLPLREGKDFTKNDVKSKNKVAIVGPLVADEFFPNVSPIGKKIKIENDYYEIVGVSKPRNQDFDDNVRIPYTAMEETLDVDKFSGLAVKVNPDKDIKIATRQIELALLRDLDEDDFTVLSPQDILESVNNILEILTLVLGAIAGISLVVGGIGIMNIMLVSVTERIREIGLRKAVGATPFNIGSQFLIESILLSVGGGGIGLLLGFLASRIAQQWIRAEVTIGAVLLAFGFSVLVGIIFGTYPAIQAAKKDPVEALRYE